MAFAQSWHENKSAFKHSVYSSLKEPFKSNNKISFYFSYFGHLVYNEKEIGIFKHFCSIILKFLKLIDIINSKVYQRKKILVFIKNPEKFVKIII